MRIFLAALLLAAGLLCPCAHAERDEAARFLENKAKAERGDAFAQHYVGLGYREGVWVAKDYEEAVKWLRKSAESGDAGNQYYLGVCYYKGKCVAQDLVEAYAWLNLASKTNQTAER